MLCGEVIAVRVTGSIHSMPLAVIFSCSLAERSPMVGRKVSSLAWISDTIALRTSKRFLRSASYLNKSSGFSFLRPDRLR